MTRATSVASYVIDNILEPVGWPSQCQNLFSVEQAHDLGTVF